MPRPSVNPKGKSVARRKTPPTARTNTRRNPQTAIRPDKQTFEDAFIRFANERDARPVEKLVGAKSLALIFEAAVKSEKSDKVISAIAIPGTILAVGGALAYVRGKDSKPLAAFALGMAGLWPFFHSMTHQTAPSKQQLMDAATLKQKRFLIALLEFLEALGDGSIKAYEKVTPHSRTQAYREIDSSLFRADHALAAIIGGHEYWKCVKAKALLNHRLPTTELYFDISSCRAKPYLTGKWLVEAQPNEFHTAKSAIKARFPDDAVIEKHLKYIEGMRKLDPKQFVSGAAKASVLFDGPDNARTVQMLAEGQLDYFESRLRQVEVDGLS